MFAVFKRDFAAYFLNPTGYLFICVFVLLGSACAFLPDDFVNNNLANLDQLNLRFPLIMLVFIPAVSMGIWAEERRNGTGELLLTSPLSVGRIVFGKYLALVGIFTAALSVSLLANGVVLRYLGRPDMGLFLATYLGYWLIGLLMLSFGMFASFLTRQLTIAYILGALLNIPLIAFAYADAFPFPKSVASFLQKGSLPSFFESFGQGVVTLSGILYFLLIPAVVLYVCLVLADLHRWSARRPIFHATRFGFRAVAFLLLTVSIVGMVRQHDVRFDWTEEKLGTLSPESLELIDSFASDYPLVIEAYLSPEVPPEYVQTRTDLIAVLNEIKNRLGNKVFLSIHSVQPNTQAAYQLEKRYDIRPRKVVFDSRGQTRETSIFLTVIFRSGPKTIAIPFMNRGLSVEYETVAALVNVGNRVKKRIGILKTDASLLGRTDSSGAPILSRWPIIDELARQYSIEEVDASEPIPAGRYDAILAVEPSSLDATSMVHFAAAIARGDAVILFEDPFPLFVSDFLAGTDIPKRMNPAIGSYPTPKGEIGQIWSLLGIIFGKDILWKNYNPYPKLAFFSEEFVFVDADPIRLEGAEEGTKGPGKQGETEEEGKISGKKGNGAKGNEVNGNGEADGKSLLTDRFAKRQETEKEITPFCPTEPAVASLSHLLFPFTGYLIPNRSAGTDVLPLILTSAGGTTSVEDIINAKIYSRARKRTEKEGNYILAAKITGEIPKMFRRPKDKEIPHLNVILVCDVDLLTPGFFRLREKGIDAASGITLDFDNVAFVLNAIDSVAGDEPLIAIRSRRTCHRTLTTIEEATRKIQNDASLAQIRFYKELEEEQERENEKLNQKISDLYNRNRDGKGTGTPDPKESREIESAIVAMQDRLSRLFDEKKEQYDRKVEETRRQMDESIRKIQGRYKLYAVLFPPIPPLVVGVIVFIRRRIARLRDRRR